MAGSRRLQRSIRVSVAVSMLGLAAVAVIAAVVTSMWVDAAAVFSLLAGATSSRIIYTEVTQSRREAAHDRAELAKDFGSAMTTAHDEHAEFTAMMSSRLAERDRTISELDGTVRLAEKWADEAEVRVKRESQRADEAREQLAVLLDQVAAQQAALEGADVPEAADLPTIVDLLAWEDRAGEEMLEDLRHQA
jgi:hypothetical protein